MLFRIFKMIATSGFLAALECTKFVFGRGSPRPSSWFKGDLLLRGREREGGRGEEGGEGKERGGEEKGKERGRPPYRKFLDPPVRATFALSHNGRP